ncbi:MAG TPA: Crp/Fnr family transcriptional regulator, partial [Thermoanaerobaculia bacterium]|nr:Crp/Fnr family transcriptional regulator [Thermoanaerobaculia bacterium]
PSDIFYTLIDGRVKIFKVTPDGRDIILGIFEPGEPLGAVAVYRAVDYPATAETIEESTVLAIPRRDLFNLLETYPTLTRGLLGALSLRLFEMAGRLAELTSGRLESRFARLFLKFANSMGTSEANGVFVPLHLSRQELADFTGTTIETAIRIMSRWGKDGLVVTEKDGFRIPDREELEALALS